MNATEKLIQLVKPRSFLYDLCDPEYKNRSKRLQMWNVIAKEMGSGDGTYWSMRWKGLKDNYGKYKKTNEAGSGPAYKKYKNWPWAGRMKFLDGFRYSSGTRRYDRPSDYDSSLVETSAASELKYCNILYIPETKSNSTVEEMQNSKKKRTENNLSETKKPKLNHRVEETETVEYQTIKRTVQQPALDGIDYFFLSYAQSFKKLPNNMQIMLKLEIATLFSQYELEAECPTSESNSNIPQIVKVESDYCNKTDN